MLIAQAFVERGVLDSITSGIGTFFEQAGYYARQPWSIWVAVIVLIALAWLFLRPSR
jgi:hypothetical protein